MSAQIEQQPFFCADCDRELKGHGIRQRDGRYICARCAGKYAKKKQGTLPLLAVGPAGTETFAEQTSLFNPAMRANVQGYRDATGFHPIRGDKEKYNEFLAGDFDDAKREVKKRLRLLTKETERAKEWEEFEKAESKRLGHTEEDTGSKVGGRTLAQFVRARGGIVPGGMYAGELRRLGRHESGTTGLINQKARQGSVKQTGDIMREAANEAGYRDRHGREFENVGDFIMAVEESARADSRKVKHGRKAATRAQRDRKAMAKAMQGNPLLSPSLVARLLPVLGRDFLQRLIAQDRHTALKLVRQEFAIYENIARDDRKPTEDRAAAAQILGALGTIERYLDPQANPLHPLEVMSHLAMGLTGVHTGIALHDYFKAKRRKRSRRNPYSPTAEEIEEARQGMQRHAESEAARRWVEEERKQPRPKQNFEDDDEGAPWDEEEAFELGTKQARALGRSEREHRQRAKFYFVTWYSPLRGKRTGFIRPIEAHSASEAKRQAKAMIENDPKATNFVAKEATRNPKVPRNMRAAFNAKVRQLINEGYKQDQAVAIAYSEWRAGTLKAKNPHKSFYRLSTDVTRKQGEVLRKANQLFSQADTAAKRGNDKEANRLSQRAKKLMARAFGKYQDGPVGTLPNPRLPRPYTIHTESNERVGGEWATKAEAVKIAQQYAKNTGRSFWVYKVDVRGYERPAQHVRPKQRNPRKVKRANPKAIDQFSEMFHGRVSGARREVPVSVRVRNKNLARLGGLPYLKMVDRPRGHGDPKHACGDCSIVLNPAQSFLCATPQHKLVLAGSDLLRAGKQLRAAFAEANPGKRGDVNLGRVEVLFYDTIEKHSNSGMPILYYHPTAEETRRNADRPALCIDPNGMLYLKGGRYKIDQRGIIN